MNMTGLSNSILLLLSLSVVVFMSSCSGVKEVTEKTGSKSENLFIAMERRISMLQSQTAQERYEKTIKETPELILNIPLQYTASFLGITPQHLSRLRKGV